MERVGHVAELDHLGHAMNILTCLSHVKLGFRVQAGRVPAGTEWLVSALQGRPPSPAWRRRVLDALQGR
jgi:hypothetical protein